MTLLAVNSQGELMLPSKTTALGGTMSFFLPRKETASTSKAQRVVLTKRRYCQEHAVFATQFPF